MTSPSAPSSWPRTIARLALGVFLVTAGIGHFVATETFLAQTPTWLPARTLLVWVSGLIEIGLGLALIGLPRHRATVGWIVAALLVAVFPGNIHQAVSGTDAFGLDTSTARWVRLAFQPLLIAWALWSTGAWWSWAERRRAGEAG